jgi:hypothetical protein
MANNESHPFFNFFRYWLLGIPTAIIGYAIHHSIFWSVMDFIFLPLAWIKWLICQEVSVSVIKSAFSFFLK